MARLENRSSEQVIRDGAGPVKSMPADGDDGVRPVDPDPYRFRTGRWALVAESGVLALIGAAGLAVNLSGQASGPDGAAVAFLHLTWLHALVLLVTGLLGLASALRRRLAMIFAGVQAVSYLLLFAIGVTLAARGVPTAMGFDYADAVLHGAVAVAGLALSMWLAGRALEGWWWVRR